MDPFSSSRTPVGHQAASPLGQDRTPAAPASAAGLRRSAGLFNLKLHPDTPDDSNENVPDEQFAREPVPPLPAMYPAMFTPESSANTSALGALSHAPNASVMRRRPTLSLKRPHPFSSAKPATKSGFLARSSTNRQDSSPQSGVGRKPLASHPKRLHLTKDDSLSFDSSSRQAEGAMTPELSFRGARPVQTAFTSTGLQSKRAVSMQSPKPRVPETPCKRPVASTGDISSIHLSDSSTRQFPPFLINGEDTAFEEQSPSRSASASAPGVGDSPLLAHSKNSFTKLASTDSVEGSNGSSAPVDRMQRFSLEHLIDPAERESSYSHSADAELSNLSVNSVPIRGSTESLDPPETPTRFGDFHTSTPLASLDFNNRGLNVNSGGAPAAARQVSEAVTMTPGTAVRGGPAPSLRSQAHTNNNNTNANANANANVLRSIDPADSMSLSPPESLDLDTYSITNSSPSDGSLSSPRTPDVRGNRRRAPPGSQSSNSTGPLIASTSTESQSSPQPRRRQGMRFFGLNGSGAGANAGDGGDEKRPHPPIPPPIRVETPLGSHSGEPRTPGHAGFNALFDQALTNQFDNVQGVVLGEFSAVFVVTQGKARYAVKRTKKPLLGQRERARRQEEVNILRRLQRSPTSADTLTVSQDDDAAEHIVHLFDEWESDGYGYIMTEFCENGDLNQFLAAQGRVSRLEEWRVWKILVELTLGLAYIHEQDVLHLDLKPANVFVTFEGHLKIGDFGMATTYPVAAGFEREGDREYIAPEVLERHQYGKPADVFSMGLMMVEIAANIVLPDNGVHWHRLRSGDLTDAGRLSSGDLAGAEHSSRASSPPPWAPPFLVDKSYALDLIVTAMLNPQPEKRPTVETLLAMPELMFVNARGQAGAIVYEGEYGPAPDDPEVMNVWQRT